MSRSTIPGEGIEGPTDTGESAGGGHFLSELGRAALELAKAGFEVLPLRPPCGGDRCLVWPAKHDCAKPPATSHGFYDATTDLDVITSWWTDCPTYNIGIRVPEGVIVLDEDPRNGGAVADLGALPDTLRGKTGGDGSHIWFRYPGPTGSTVGGCRGIDIKTHGGYVVVGPSIHPSGNGYGWLGSYLDEIAELPAELVERVKGPKQTYQSGTEHPVGEPPGTPGKPLTELNRAAGVLEPEIWLTVLPADWEFVGECTEGHQFARPDGDSDRSAVAYRDRPGTIHIFSTAADVQVLGKKGARTYTFADLYAWIVGQSVGQVSSDVNDYINDEPNTHVAEFFAEWPEVLEQLRAKVRKLGKAEPVEDDEVIDAETGGEAQHDEEELELVSFATMTMKRARWLWEESGGEGADYLGGTRKLIPIAALTLLTGREETGKSSVTCDIAAKITTGTLPGESFGTPRDVIMVGTEESLETIVLPRLTAMGADLSRIHGLRRKLTKEGALLRFPEDAHRLKKLCAAHDIALIAIDPITTVISGKLDQHREGEVRQSLEPVVELARETGTAVLGLIHFNKSGTADPMSRIMGSRAFGAVPRSVLMCAVVEGEDGEPPTRYFGQAKNNLAPKASKARPFSMESVKVGDDDGAILGSRVIWGDIADVDIREAACADQSGKTKTKQISKKDACKAWIEGRLSGAAGDVKRLGLRTTVLVTDAEAALHSTSTFFRAIKELEGEGKARKFTMDLAGSRTGKKIELWRWVAGE